MNDGLIFAVKLLIGWGLMMLMSTFSINLINSSHSMGSWVAGVSGLIGSLIAFYFYGKYIFKGKI